MNDFWKHQFEKLLGLKDLASIGLAEIIGNGITAVFWFYIATLLDPAKYGEIFYFIGIAGISSYFATIGTQNVITVYAAKKIPLQSTLYFLSLVTGAISSLVIILIFYRIDVSILLLGYIINTLAIGDLLGRGSYSNYSRYTIIQKISTTVIGIGFYYLFGADGIIYGLAISYTIFIIRIYKGLKSSRIDLSLLRTRLGFVINNYFIYLTGSFGGQIDKLIIVPLLGFTILGNYSLAMQMITMLSLFNKIIFKYILTHDAMGNQNRNLKRVTILVSVIMMIVGIVFAPIIIPFTFPKYTKVIEAIQIMSLSIIPSTIAYLFWSKFLALEKSKYVLISTSIGVFVIILGIITLGPIFGIIGLAIAFVLSESVHTITLLSINQYLKRRK